MKFKNKVLRSKSDSSKYILLERTYLSLYENGTLKKYYYIKVGKKIKLLYEIVD